MTDSRADMVKQLLGLPLGMHVCVTEGWRQGVGNASVVSIASNTTPDTATDTQEG